MKLLKHLTIGLFASGLVLFAQGPRGFGQGQGQGQRPQGRPASQTRLLDPSKIQVVTGVITAVNLSYGAQYPSIAVNETQIKLAPLWFLLESDFELKPGDNVRVVAARSFISGDLFLHAIEMANTSTGATIQLREPDGTPLWSRRQASGQNVRAAGACVDPASIRVVAGTLEKVNAGTGIQMPTIVLKTPDGSLLTIKIGPERVLLASDFELHEGQALTAKIALAACTGEYIALELTNEAGVTLALRTDDGRPVWTH